MSKFLDATGLTYFKGKIETLLSGKVDKVTGKGLSTNDYTTAEQTKLSGIESGANNYTHPTHPAKSSGLYKVTIDASGHVSGASAVAKSDITDLGIPGQDTTYETVTGSTDGLMSSADKAKLDSFGSASSYALKTDIASMYKYKGTVAAVANLPASGNTTGDVYNVEANDMNYAWNGTEWDSLGGMFSINAITNSEIDAMFT